MTLGSLFRLKVDSVKKGGGRMFTSFNINTYSLKENNEKNSNTYYEELSNFTDLVFEKVDELCSDIVNEFYEYQRFNHLELSLNKKEIILEFLVVAVLYQSYIGKAMGANILVEKCLYYLTELRQINIYLKKIVDPVRGILATIHYKCTTTQEKEEVLLQSINLECFNRLIKWLQASGEFNQEILIMNRWYKFLASKSAVKSNVYIKDGLKLADWFSDYSKKSLGKYTKKVEKFLVKHGREHFWNEDVIFCNRKRVEYHLNMVGAEILNRAYREDFIKAEKRLIVVPACMRLDDKSCRAEKTPFGDRCTACNNKCNVSYLKNLGKDADMSVYIVPHETMLFKKRDENTIGKDVGLVGIACPLHLISGGLKSKGMGIPAQCVLLDYCGCKNHWDKEGITTDINYDKLEQIMDLSYRFEEKTVKHDCSP